MANNTLIKDGNLFIYTRATGLNTISFATDAVDAVTGVTVTKPSGNIKAEGWQVEFVYQQSPATMAQAVIRNRSATGYPFFDPGPDRLGTGLRWDYPSTRFFPFIVASDVTTGTIIYVLTSVGTYDR